MMDHTVWKSLFLSLCLGTLGSRLAVAQLTESLPVSVTAVFENSVYLDQGRARGVEVENQVVLRTPGGSVTARVRSVTENECRCELDEPRGDVEIEVGGHGEVRIRLDGPKRLPSTVDEVAEVATEHRGPFKPASLQQTGPGSISRVDVVVTASSAGSIYIDKGRAAQIQPGDEVILYPPGSGIVNATVQAVSRSNARCTVLSSDARIDLGTRGEVLIPENRLLTRANQTQLTDTQRPPADHPPWRYAPEQWDQSQPLLAPAYSRQANEREPELRGRMFANYLHTWNPEYNHNQYFLARLGTAMWLDNAFHQGGTLQLFGEFNARGVFLEDFDDVDSPGRLDRISYSWGGTEDRPIRYELGRFLSYEFPEFGFIDGAELSYRTENNSRWGISVGFLPEPFPNLNFVNDFQVSTYYRFAGGSDEAFLTGIGFQKVWHEGTPDRDLLVYTLDYHPGDRVSVYGTIWGDFYDSRDTLKSTPFEITQAIAQATYRFSRQRGTGIYVSQIRWPQLLRREYSPFLDEQVVNGRVFRYGLFAWQQLGQRTRLDGRVDHWDDQDNEHGTSWEGRLSFRDLLCQQSEVTFAVYGTDGIYTSGPGSRVVVYRFFPRCVLSSAYDITDYKYQIDGTSFVQQNVQTNIDFTLGSGKSVSFFSDYRFGDRQKAFQLGVFLQKQL